MFVFDKIPLTAVVYVCTAVDNVPPAANTVSAVAARPIPNLACLSSSVFNSSLAFVVTFCMSVDPDWTPWPIFTIYPRISSLMATAGSNVPVVR